MKLSVTEEFPNAEAGGAAEVRTVTTRLSLMADQAPKWPLTGGPGTKVTPYGESGTDANIAGPGPL